MRRWIEEHQVLAVALIGAVAYVAWVLRYVLVVLFIGYLIAAAVRPAVDWLERYRVPRVVGILGLYVAFFGAVGWAITSALVPILSQTQLFGQKLAQTSHALTVHVPLFGPDQLQSLIQFLQQQAGQVAASSFVVAAGVLTAVIISIYLLYDWHRLHSKLGGRVRQAMVRAVRDSDVALGAWVRGQALLSSAVAVLSFIALMVLGVEFAPVLALLAWVFEFIPYAGPFLAGAPAVFLALGESTSAALFVAVAYVVIQQLESHVLAPMIMRRATDLHPVVVILSMLAGFEVLGIPGMLLAVPVTVVARIMIVRLWDA